MDLLELNLCLIDTDFMEAVCHKTDQVWYTSMWYRIMQFLQDFIDYCLCIFQDY